MAEMARFDSAGSTAQATALDHFTSIDARLASRHETVLPIEKPVPRQDPAFEIAFEDGDAKDPRCWPLWYRAFVIFTMSYSTTAVVLYSTAYTASIAGVIEYFKVSRLLATLGLSVYLFGMAIGSVISAPFSEMYGRKPVYLITMVMFLMTVIPTGITKSFAGILAPRFFSGFAAAALVTNSPGSVNDIVIPKYRALAFSFWMPLVLDTSIYFPANTGPLIGGFVFQYLGFRWISWLTMILNGAALVLLIICKETYRPTILQNLAQQKRKETGDARWWCVYDEKQELLPLLKVNLSRPFIYMFTEPICIFWNFYVGLVYGVLYLSFVAYPMVFQTERGWSPSMGGLAFCGIGLGTLLVIASEPLCRWVINQHRHDPETGKPYPEAAVSIVCFGAVLLAVGQMVFAWTSAPHIHWIFPIVFGGIPFGAGNASVFIYSNNYLAGSYGNFAASCLAGNAVIRSIMGGCLPLAGPQMYSRLGSAWASCVLSLLEFAFIPIPFVFYLYGDRIRSRSAVIKQTAAYK